MPPNGGGKQTQPKGVLELDRFSEQNVNRWNAASKDINELNDVLYYHLEPERRKHKGELLGALAKQPPIRVELQNWWRIVDYQFTLNPLSSAGSLQYVGGRFNAGTELEPGTLKPWPTLYLAENYNTAFFEKFQISHDAKVDGLTPQDLSLNGGGSHTTVLLRGHLSNVFDLTKSQNLNEVAKVLARIYMPLRAKQLKKKLSIKPRDLVMVQTGKQLFDFAVEHNWRVLPVQFGTPSQSQILAEMIKSAGFEAILYRSTKGTGKCIAVFTEELAAGSFIEVADPVPPELKHRRLDSTTAVDLAGWETVAHQFRC